MAQKNSKRTAPQSVLTARFSALGDVAMTIPVVYSACRCYPESKFTLVTRPAFTDLFLNAPANLTVTGADVKKKYAGPGGLLRLARELREHYRPDIYVDLHNVLRTRLLGLFLRLGGVAGFTLVKPRRARRAMTRHNNKVLSPLPSQRALFREVFLRAGLPVENHFEGLFVGGRYSAPASLFASITAPRDDSRPWIGIAPFAAHAGKIYPPELMEKVVADICAHYGEDGVRLFLFGGGGDEGRVLGEWAERYGACTSLAGKRYGFAAELGLMNHLDAMIAMDSGNMHLASIAGTQVLSIWGATHHYCGFRPWNQPSGSFIELPLACRPCSVFGNKPCQRGDYMCLRAIRPDTICNRLYTLLSQKNKR